jgi:hypothetical protein
MLDAIAIIHATQRTAELVRSARPKQPQRPPDTRC